MSIEDEKKRLAEYKNAPLIEKCKGDDWFQLSEAEHEVFGLDYEDMPELAAVHDLYYCTIGISDNIGQNRINSLKNELPWLRECNPDAGEWQRFAALFGVSNRKAHAFWCKHDFWENRLGVVTYKDEKDYPMRP